jgi:hypothetical protein
LHPVARLFARLSTERVMQLYDPDGKYKRLDSYLRWDFSEMRVNEAVVNALAKWGQMLTADARNYLSSGHGPYIRVVADLDKTKTNNPVLDFPDVIYLIESIVNSFEKNDESSRLGTGNGKRIYKVGLTILENIILGHRSYYHLQKDIAKLGLPLLSFERELYGGVRWTVPTH